MNFTFAHNNLNVYDLDASLQFYKEALGLTVTRTKKLLTAALSLFISEMQSPLINWNLHGFEIWIAPTI